MNREDRFAGALLGTAIGDALGAPLEGAPCPQVVRDIIEWPYGRGRYTDDTQMSLALTESLIRSAGIDGRDCARAYAERFDPARGYGPTARKVLPMLREGADYRGTGTALFPEGSLGSGGAMRIAPVGLVYGAGEACDLRDAVFEAIRCTHVHPEAVDGAVIQARLVGLLSTMPDRKPLRFTDVEEELRQRVVTAAFASRIKALGKLLAEGADDRAATRLFGTGMRAVEGIPVAVWCAFRHGFHPEESIVRAVAMGGDTDTIGAMTGALVGAFRGASALPQRWLAGLENGPGGRDDIVKLSRLLASLQVRKVAESEAPGRGRVS